MTKKRPAERGSLVLKDVAARVAHLENLADAHIAELQADLAGIRGAWVRMKPSPQLPARP